LKKCVKTIKETLGYGAEERKVVKSDEDYYLREEPASYIADSGHKQVTLSDDNTYLLSLKFRP